MLALCTDYADAVFRLLLLNCFSCLLGEDFSFALEDESPGALPLEVEQLPVPEGLGENLPVDRELIDLGDPVVRSAPAAAQRSRGPTSPGKRSRPRKERGQSSRKSKGKTVAHPQPPSARVPMLLPGEEAEIFFKDARDRHVPPMPTAFTQAAADGARGGMSLALMVSLTPLFFYYSIYIYYFFIFFFFIYMHLSHTFPS